MTQNLYIKQRMFALIFLCKNYSPNSFYTHISKRFKNLQKNKKVLFLGCSGVS